MHVIMLTERSLREILGDAATKLRLAIKHDADPEPSIKRIMGETVEAMRREQLR